MAKEKKARRFEPRYGVSAAALEVEAGYLAVEIRDYEMHALSDLDSKRKGHNASCRNTWEQLHLVIGAMPERDQRVLQTLLYRDLWYVLELYRTHLHPIARQLPPVSATAKPVAAQSMQFSEWLFEIPQRHG